MVGVDSSFLGFRRLASLHAGGASVCFYPKSCVVNKKNFLAQQQYFFFKTGAKSTGSHPPDASSHQACKPAISACKRRKLWTRPQRLAKLVISFFKTPTNEVDRSGRKPVGILKGRGSPLLKPDRVRRGIVATPRTGGINKGGPKLEVRSVRRGLQRSTL